MDEKTRLFVSVSHASPEYRAEEFTQWILSQAAQRHISWGELLNAADIDTSRGYRILRGALRPMRNEVLRLALSMCLGINGARLTLKLAGYGPLSPEVRRDAAVIMCLRRQLDVPCTNAFLRQRSLPEL